METIKNPYCLDPKETRCPRLDRMGLEWNPRTGRLDRTSVPPQRPTDVRPEHHHSTTELIRHNDEGHLDDDEVDNHLQNHIRTLKEEFLTDLTRSFKSALKKSTDNILSFGGGTQEVLESMDQHKYAKLAQASYDYYNDRDALSNLRDPKNDYVPGLKDFEIDKLSTKDDLVLRNPKTGEVVISFRGTQEAEAVKDWWVNSRIGIGPRGGQETGRFKNAEKLIKKVIFKYGKQNLKVTGHSQGGGLSSHFGSEFDVTSHSYDPAISMKQISDHGNEKYLENTSEHFIYRPTGDVVSINTHAPSIKRAFDVKNLNSTEELGDKMLNLHDLELAHPQPIGVTMDGRVRVVRNTDLASLKGATKGALELGGQVLTAYDTITDMANDLKQGRQVSASLDTAKNVGEYYLGDLAFGGISAATASSLAALGVETGLAAAAAPIAIGIMGAVAVGAGIEIAVDELKNTKFIKTADKSVTEALESADQGWRNLEDKAFGVENFAEKAAEYDIYDLGDDIATGTEAVVSGVEAAGSAIVSGVKSVGHWLGF